LNNGDGTLAPHVDYATTLTAEWTVLGDFNGDGILDIASANVLSVSLLVGKGDGTFLPSVDLLTFANTGIPVESMVAADVNQDGRLDLAGVSLQLAATELSYHVHVMLQSSGAVGSLFPGSLKSGDRAAVVVEAAEARRPHLGRALRQGLTR
jgi:FG-GAP-like repeat